MFGFLFSIGSIAGSFLGGALASPAQQYPSLFGGIKFFEDYPFFLALSASAFVSFAGACTGYLWLQETLKSTVQISLPQNSDDSLQQLAPQISTNNLCTGFFRDDPEIPEEETPLIGSPCTAVEHQPYSIKESLIPIACYSVLAFQYNTYFEVYSIFSATGGDLPGLSFSPAMISIVFISASNREETRKLVWVPVQ